MNFGDHLGKLFGAFAGVPKTVVGATMEMAQHGAGIASAAAGVGTSALTDSFKAGNKIGQQLASLATQVGPNMAMQMANRVTGQGMKGADFGLNIVSHLANQATGFGKQILNPPAFGQQAQNVPSFGAGMNVGGGHPMGHLANQHVGGPQYNHNMHNMHNMPSQFNVGPNAEQPYGALHMTGGMDVSMGQGAGGIPHNPALMAADPTTLALADHLVQTGQASNALYEAANLSRAGISIMEGGFNGAVQGVRNAIGNYPAGSQHAGMGGQGYMATQQGYMAAQQMHQPPQIAHHNAYQPPQHPPNWHPNQHHNQHPNQYPSQHPHQPPHHAAYGQMGPVRMHGNVHGGSNQMDQPPQDQYRNVQPGYEQYQDQAPQNGGDYGSPHEGGYGADDHMSWP